MVITSGPEMSSPRLAIVIGPRAGVCWVMYLAEELSGLVCNCVHLGVCTSAERETLLVVVGCGQQQRSHKRYKLRVQFPHTPYAQRGFF